MASATCGTHADSKHAAVCDRNQAAALVSAILALLPGGALGLQGRFLTVCSPAAAAAAAALAAARQRQHSPPCCVDAGRPSRLAEARAS